MQFLEMKFVKISLIFLPLRFEKERANLGNLKKFYALSLKWRIYFLEMVVASRTK